MATISAMRRALISGLSTLIQYPQAATKTRKLESTKTKARKSFSWFRGFVPKTAVRMTVPKWSIHALEGQLWRELHDPRVTVTRRADIQRVNGLPGVRLIEMCRNRTHAQIETSPADQWEFACGLSPSGQRLRSWWSVDQGFCGIGSVSRFRQIFFSRPLIHVVARPQNYRLGGRSPSRISRFGGNGVGCGVELCGVGCGTGW